MKFQDILKLIQRGRFSLRMRLYKGHRLNKRANIKVLLAAKASRFPNLNENQENKRWKKRYELSSNPLPSKKKLYQKLYILYNEGV